MTSLFSVRFVLILWIFLLYVCLEREREICLFLASTDPQAMSGRGGGGRRSDSRPDHSSPAPDQSVNRGGGGRGRGYGSPNAGGPRPAPEFNSPANFQPLSSPSPSASTYAAALSREFDKSLTLQSPSSDPIQPQSQTPVPR